MTQASPSFLRRLFLRLQSKFSRYIEKKIAKKKRKILKNYDDNYLFSVTRQQHQKVFPAFKGIHRGKDIVLVATGKTLSKYHPIEGAIHIGVNRAIQHKEITYDYFFLQDYSGSQGYIGEINRYRPDKCVKFYGRQGVDNWIIPEFQIEEANAIRYYTTYPYHVFKYDISVAGLADFGSIVFSAVSFALWTRPKRIYLVGCDCSNLYFDNQKSGNFSYLINGWKELKAFHDTYYPDTEIISINPVGLKGLFNDLYTENS